jgi:hypothetical protein
MKKVGVGFQMLILYFEMKTQGLGKLNDQLQEFS